MGIVTHERENHGDLIKEIAKTVQDTHDSSLRTEGRVERIEEKVTGIEKCLYGNGKPGIRIEMDRVNQWKEGHTNEHKEKLKKWSTRTWSLAVLLMVGTLSLVTTLFAKILEHIGK